MNALADPLDHLDPADVLARTIWGEARGESKAGREAVAAVVMNRVGVAGRHGGRFWWGNDVVSVCLKPWQFSCWNANDPNRAKLQAVDENNRVFAQCRRIADAALTGELDDPTDGATHYHVEGLSPPWSLGSQPVTQIGGHLFYKDIG